MESALLVLDICQLRNVTLDDEALMREVVRALLIDASERIDDLRGAIERADALECARLAHTAQGACGNVGAASMAALFWSIEQNARAGDFNLCKSALENLSIELDKLRFEADLVCLGEKPTHAGMAILRGASNQ
jgi:HPt (histidine-containing phosphotransfer) domain-containing protein